MDSKQKGFAIAALRKASYRWPARNEAFKNARKGRNQYECAACKNIFPNKGVDKDHINPIVPISGWDGFDGYIERLFAPVEGWQVVCKDCHSLKTKSENFRRKEHRHANTKRKAKAVKRKSRNR